MIRRLVKKLLTERLVRRYEKELAARNITYDEWVRREEARRVKERQEKAELTETQSAGPRPEEVQSAGSRSGEAQPAPPVVLLCSGRGRLAEHARERAESFFREHPDAVLAYGDEDVEDCAGGPRRCPWYKPDWSPDTFCSYYYFGSVLAVRRDWADKLSGDVRLPGKYPDEDFGAFYDLVWDLADRAGGFQKGCRAIGHIPEILFHADGEDVQTFYQGYGRGRTPEEVPEGASIQEDGPLPTVSVIIPSKDNPALLRQCIDSVRRTAGAPFELLVVDNGSGEENRKEIAALLEGLPLRTRYLYRPMEFNFSRMCNLGAEHAEGEVLLFLNDDVEARSPGWLSLLARQAKLPYAGAAGMKLYYPESRRMQHDGIVNLPMGPVHKLQFLTDEESYDHGRNRFDWNVLAVTGACLACEAGRFREAGGFDETLTVAFNDADLCFRLWELGYVNTVINRAYAWHHESLSRGADESAEKLERLQRERKRLYQKHPGLAGRDPYYPEGLNRDCLDTRIRPAFVTAANRPQGPAFRTDALDWSKIRQDECLLVRVERCDEQLQGYAVVLGDDNACYEFTLVLRRQDAGGKAGSPESGGREDVWMQALASQYRPDLEENLPDQKHVALCGFCIDLRGAGDGRGALPEGAGDGRRALPDGTGSSEALPEGTYRIGVLAESRVSRLKLINFSNRIFRSGADEP